MGTNEEKADTTDPLAEEVEGFNGRQMKYWKKLCWEWRVGFTPIPMENIDPKFPARKWHFIVHWDGWTPIITDPREMDATTDEETQRTIRGPVKTLHVTHVSMAVRWWVQNIKIPAKRDQMKLLAAFDDMDDAPKERPDRSDKD